jgi:glyoxylase-like metal-dependent hydrolase (beta-lactamase superfamily II)
MQTLTIGDVTIDAVIEREGPWRKPTDFFPDFNKDIWDHYLPQMEPEMFDQHLGLMLITYQTFLIRTPHHNILVDTCTGEDKNHPAPFDFPGKVRWKNELMQFGVAFEDIHYVFCTHLHVDHTGWNTTLLNGRWVPTFPNAHYIFHKKEYEMWERETKGQDNLAARVFKNNCLPIVEAGQAILVDDDFVIDDTISLIPTPGHSPHHCCVVVQSKGMKAIITGDLFHHAIQCCVPKWSSCFDWDAKQAIISRERFLADVADTDIVILPIHFPKPTAGFICTSGASFHYKFKR